MGVQFSCFSKPKQEAGDVERSVESSRSLDSSSTFVEPLTSESMFFTSRFLSRSSLHDYNQHNNMASPFSQQGDEQVAQESPGNSTHNLSQYNLFTSSIRNYSRINSRTISGQQVNLEIDLERDLNPPISEAIYIGGGAFGEVYKTNYEGRPVAVKIFYDRHQQSVNEQDDQFTNELEIVCRLEHSNIVEFVGASRLPNQKAIVMEFMESSLYSFIRRPRDEPIHLITVLQVIKDIAKALHYLHQKFAHADLHSENVLIGADGVPKIVDFNLSQLVQYNSRDSLDHGAPAYAAPELFVDKKISKRSDIYSLGMLAWEMWTKKCPWTGYGYFAIIENVVAGNRPEIPADMPPQLQSLIKKCWQQNRCKRPTAKQVYWYCKRTLKQIQSRKSFNQLFENFKKQMHLKL